MSSVHSKTKPICPHRHEQPSALRRGHNPTMTPARVWEARCSGSRIAETTLGYHCNPATCNRGQCAASNRISASERASAHLVHISVMVTRAGLSNCESLSGFIDLRASLDHRARFGVTERQLSKKRKNTVGSPIDPKTQLLRLST